MGNLLGVRTQSNDMTGIHDLDNKLWLDLAGHIDPCSTQNFSRVSHHCNALMKPYIPCSTLIRGQEHAADATPEQKSAEQTSHIPVRHLAHEPPSLPYPNYSELIVDCREGVNFFQALVSQHTHIHRPLHRVSLIGFNGMQAMMLRQLRLGGFKLISDSVRELSVQELWYSEWFSNTLPEPGTGAMPKQKCLFHLTQFLNLTHLTLIGVAWIHMGSLVTECPALTSLQIDSVTVFCWELTPGLVHLKNLSVTSTFEAWDAQINRGLRGLSQLTGLTLMSQQTLQQMVVTDSGDGSSSSSSSSSTSLLGLNNIVSLCLRYKELESQPLLDDIARHLMGVRVLDLDIIGHSETMVPDSWSQLQCVRLSCGMGVGVSVLTPALRRLVIHKQPLLTTGPEQPGPYAHLQAFPSSTQMLQAPYNQLMLAAGCTKLTHLTLTPCEDCEAFGESEQVGILEAAGAGVWGALEVVAFVQNLRGTQWDHFTDRCPQSVRNSQLLDAISGPDCSVTHATLLDSRVLQELTLTALCRMPLLQSVTFADMTISVAQLKQLVLGECRALKIIELLGVHNITPEDCKAVRAVSNGRVRILCRGLSSLLPGDMCGSVMQWNDAQFLGD